MKVHLRLFALARDLCNAERLEIEIAEGATISDLRKTLANEAPALATVLRSSLFAVAAEYVPDQFTLSEGVQVACIPPVSGG